MKNTVQRTLILDELKKLDSHPTAKELYTIVKKKSKNIGLCTIYRNLENYYKQGLIGKINGKPARYDWDLSGHSHIRCVSCGKVADVRLKMPINPVEIDKLGYKLHSYKIELIGFCKSCVKKIKNGGLLNG